MPFQRTFTRPRLTCGSFLLAVAPLISQTRQQGKPPAPAAVVQAQAPVQAALIAPLDLTHVHLGSTVFARVQEPWSLAGCVLAPGSMVLGRVTAITPRTKTDKTSTLQVDFAKADCKGNAEASPHFTLFAMIGPDPNDPSGKGEGTPLSNGLPMSVPSIGKGRSIGSASDLAGNMMRAAPRKLPAQLSPGEVIDVQKTHLRLDTEGEGATDVVTIGKDVRLETGTLLILLPRLAATTVASANSADSGVLGAGGPAPGNAAHAGSSAVPPLAPPPEPPDITDVCSGACTLFGKNTEETAVATQATANVSLSSVGLLATSNYELAHLKEDTDIVYLDGTHLLCTFDPHRLRERTEIEGEPSRLIRAVVINTTSFKVERVLDWRVRGNGQYLWQLSSGHLLVHLGRELKEVDANLKPVSSFPLQGRLAWVVPSPSGNHIAIGTIVERYSPEVRQQLTESLSEEPEEDINVRVFDAAHHQILSATRPSHLPPPVLSDTGEIRVQHVTRDRWRITEIDWERQEHLLADTRTSCRPALSTPRPGLVFMMGCSEMGSHWYRMLRSDGHPVLKAESPNTEIAQRAQASADGVFAIRTVETADVIDLTQPFHPSDLKEERITIYSSSNGARLQSFVASDFAPTEQGFALSPAGNQVALVGRTGLHFYPLAHAAQ